MAKKKPPKKPKNPPAEKNPDTKVGNEQANYKPGSRTSGTQLGNVREIAPVGLPDAQTYGASKIAAARDVVAPTIGPAAERSAPTINRAGDEQYRSGQLALVNDLTRQARGETPSIGELQLRQGLEQALNQTRGNIASVRGISPALAARMALRTGGAMQQQAAMQAAQTRIAEQASAREQLAATLNAGRESERLYAGQQAQLEAEAAAGNQQAINTLKQQQAELALRGSLANQQVEATRAQRQAELDTQAAADAATAKNTTALNQANFIQDASKVNQAAFNTANAQQLQSNTGIKQQSIQSGGQVAAANASAAGAVGAANASAYGTITAQQIAQEGANYRNDTSLAAGLGENAGTSGANYDNSSTGAGRGAAGDQSDVIQAGVGAAGQGASGAAVLSDERAKKNIEGGDGAAESFLEGLRARVYEYKSGGGKQLGVTAQDAEKSKMGDKIVEETPGGKAIDIPKALSAALASMANIHERLKAMEAKRA